MKLMLPRLCVEVHEAVIAERAWSFVPGPTVICFILDAGSANLVQAWSEIDPECVEAWEMVLFCLNVQHLAQGYFEGRLSHAIRDMLRDAQFGDICGGLVDRYGNAIPEKVEGVVRYLKLEELDVYDLTVDSDLVTVSCSPYKSFWGGVVLTKDEVETFPILTRFDSRTLDVLACQLHHVWVYDCFQKMFMPGGENFGGGTASRVAFVLITLNKLWVECTFLCAELIPALRVYVADLGHLGKVPPTNGRDEVVVLTQEERNWAIGL